MDGFFIMVGLVLLGLAIDNGLNNIARALGLEFKDKNDHFDR